MRKVYRRDTTRSYCIAQGAIFNSLLKTIMEKNMKKNIYIYIFFLINGYDLLRGKWSTTVLVSHYTDVQTSPIL